MPRSGIHSRASSGSLPATEKIRGALASPTTLEFVEAPFSDVVEFLKQLHRIEIQLDTKALGDVGVSPDTPITRNLKGVSLRSALNLILADLDLTWTISNEVLLITTQEKAVSMLETVVYDVHDLVAARDEKGAPVNDFDQLIDMITSTVAPTIWDSVGGPGSIAPFEGNGIAAISISQTPQIHEKIEKLLADLRRATHVKPGEPIYVRTIRTPAARPEPKPLPTTEGYPGQCNPAESKPAPDKAQSKPADKSAGMP